MKSNNFRGSIRLVFSAVLLLALAVIARDVKADVTAPEICNEDRIAKALAVYFKDPLSDSEAHIKSFLSVAILQNLVEGGRCEALTLAAEQLGVESYRRRWIEVQKLIQKLTSSSSN